uniref:Uncharacterized protein n=2 Tax=Palpitomonas bilix TaxID=652834 RepID=A0A7S3CV81_9EUKA|mmetsp:Transcript_1035/g.2166  ORF Transcript_1035/g.2166 Transcript_1035/m.2166 type:complete len:290 (+) Transcript_1035:94-963(+)
MYSQNSNSGGGAAYYNIDTPSNYDPEGQTLVAQPVDPSIQQQKAAEYVAQYVKDCGKKVRLGFIRKVYVILTMQLLLTVAIVSATMLAGCQALPDPVIPDGTNYTCPAVVYMNNNIWVFWTSFALTIVTMCILFCVRQKHPANLIMLFVFTIFESITVAAVVATYANTNEGRRAVVIAAAVTLALFVSLTIFAAQSKIDFRFIPVLIFSLIWISLIWLLFAFLPWGFSFIYMWGLLGAIIFSLYIIYDTHLVMKRLGPDEWVLGAVNLYIDVINLFICLLALIGGGGRR